MTQDFAKKKRATKQPPRRAPNKRTKAAPKPSAPAWVWLLVGCLLGAFIMFLVYLADEKSGQPQPLPAPEEEVGTVSGKSSAETTAQPQPRFDFYQILKEQEVNVSGSDAPELSTPVEKVDYILQVGSFKANGDADRLRAQLLLLNLETAIEKVKARNGETWHRVLVGPFRTRSTLAKARSILASQKIDSLLLKRKPQG